MRMNYSSRRISNGFTLIELIITLALAGIIITIIYSFFFSSITMFHRNDKDIELQQQGQFIIGFLEEKIIESCGITYLQDMNGHVKNETNEVINLKKIIFKNIPGASDKGFVFQLSKEPNFNTYSLKYGVGLSGTPTIEAGNYIEKIQVRPIPSDKIYIEAKGLDLKIFFYFDGQKKSFETQFFFRNRPGR